MPDLHLVGVRTRLFQWLARFAPGATTTRVHLHRRRGVRIGTEVFIGTDALIETSYPQLVEIGDRVSIGIRTTIIAHHRGPLPAEPTVRIEHEAFLGPGVIVLPNVTIGHGAVVTAGSVVTKSVPPMTLVQGNPAKPVGRCGVPLAGDVDIKDFYRSLRPIRAPAKGER
jgi:acetyltransferase-like isoleucine patch superfamily enzyme